MTTAMNTPIHPPKRTRRAVLRGAGAALSLPYFASLAPRRATAQSQQAGPAAPGSRYVALYFPNGTASYWRPRERGTGDAWRLSPILEPLAPVKSHVNVLTNVANYATFGGPVEPSHSNCCAATWTCVKAHGDGNQQSGISVDQVIAAQLAGQTPLPSLQLGLSTLNSYEDGLPGQHSRSISWKSADEPLYKLVSPAGLFDRLTAGQVIGVPDPGELAAAAARRQRQRSLLDFVLEDARGLSSRLGRNDSRRLDQFMTSVRALEQRIAGSADRMPGTCPVPARPSAHYGVGDVPDGYNRDEHAGLMIDLLVLAFRCDITRVASFMLDDARSDFVYDFLTERRFNADGSEPGDGRVGGYHGLQHAGDENNGFASITHWNAQKAAQLAIALRACDTSDGSHLLDHTCITFCSGMHGGNHDPGDLPVALIGGGGLRADGRPLLPGDRHLVFDDEQRLADVHLTLLRRLFNCPQPTFGSSQAEIDALL